MIGPLVMRKLLKVLGRVLARDVQEVIYEVQPTGPHPAKEAPQSQGRIHQTPRQRLQWCIQAPAADPGGGGGTGGPSGAVRSGLGGLSGGS